MAQSTLDKSSRQHNLFSNHTWDRGDSNHQLWGSRVWIPQFQVWKLKRLYWRLDLSRVLYGVGETRCRLWLLTVLKCTAQSEMHCTIHQCTVLYHTTIKPILLYNNATYCNIPQSTLLYHSTKYPTAPYQNVPHHTTIQPTVEVFATQSSISLPY